MRDRRAVRVFVSYRRGDVGGYAGRLSDALNARLGRKSVFQDVTAIEPGSDFTAVIDRALEGCTAVLAVIGPGWLTATDPDGGRRLFEDDDYVRLELARALRRDIRAVPVLVGGASLPSPEDLPEELRGLTHRQAVVLHDETWHRDVEGLVRSLRGEPPVTTRRRRWLVAAAASTAALIAGGVAWALLGRGDSARAGTEAAATTTTDSADAHPCAPLDGPGWTPIALARNPTGRTQTPQGQLTFRVEDAAWRRHDGGWQVTLKTGMRNGTADSTYHGVWRYKELVVGQRAFVPTCYSTYVDPVDPGTLGDALIGFDVRCRPVGYIELVTEADRIDVTDDTLAPGPC